MHIHENGNAERKKRTIFSLCKCVHYCVNTVLSSGMEAKKKDCKLPEKTIQNNENKGAATIGTDERKRMQVLKNIMDFNVKNILL